MKSLGVLESKELLFKLSFLVAGTEHFVVMSLGHTISRIKALLVHLIDQKRMKQEAGPFQEIQDSVIVKMLRETRRKAEREQKHIFLSLV